MGQTVPARASNPHAKEKDHLKPASFEYHDPSSVDEVLHLLSRLGADAKLLAGGQSLMPVLNMRLAAPKALIDLRRVRDLRYVRREDEHLCIGAMTPYAEVRQSTLIAASCPLLHEAVGYVGHTAIQNRGTIGGSIAHADPAAEIPTAALALGAEFSVISPRGKRQIAAADFFLGYFTTSMEPDELLTAVRLPILPDGTGSAFVEVSRRHGDFAMVGVACYLTLEENDRVGRAGLALCGVADKPVRMDAAEQLLLGEIATDAAIVAASKAAADAIDPQSDLHAEAEYRSQAAAVLVRRALQTARSRCAGHRR